MHTQGTTMNNYTQRTRKKIEEYLQEHEGSITNIQRLGGTKNTINRHSTQAIINDLNKEEKITSRTITIGNREYKIYTAKVKT